MIDERYVKRSDHTCFHWASLHSQFLEGVAISRTPASISEIHELTLGNYLK